MSTNVTNAIQIKVFFAIARQMRKQKKLSQHHLSV
jgi:hypothetical protein